MVKSTGEVWLDLGAVRLQMPSTSQARGSILDAYLGEATDGEHDSAFILSLPLIGVTFTEIHGGIASFQAWVNPNCYGFKTDFHVPGPDYDPFDGSETCSHCPESEAHQMVHNYMPPHNKELYEIVRGQPVEIYIGPAAAWE